MRKLISNKGIFLIPGEAKWLGMDRMIKKYGDMMDVIKLNAINASDMPEELKDEIKKDTIIKLILKDEEQGGGLIH